MQLREYGLSRARTVLDRDSSEKALLEIGFSLLCRASLPSPLPIPSAAFRAFSEGPARVGTEKVWRRRLPSGLLRATNRVQPSEPHVSSRALGL